MKKLILILLFYSFSAHASETECPIIYSCRASVEDLTEQKQSYLTEVIYKGKASSRNLSYAIESAFKKTGYESLCEPKKHLPLNPSFDGNWTTYDRDEKFLSAHCEYSCEEDTL